MPHLKKLVKDYKKAKRDLDPNLHPSAESEVQIIANIAFLPWLTDWVFTSLGGDWSLVMLAFAIKGAPQWLAAAALARIEEDKTSLV